MATAISRIKFRHSSDSKNVQTFGNQRGIFTDYDCEFIKTPRRKGYVFIKNAIDSVAVQTFLRSLAKQKKKNHKRGINFTTSGKFIFHRKVLLSSKTQKGVFYSDIILMVKIMFFCNY